MRRKMAVKCISAGLALCLGTCGMTGCHNKTVDYGMEEGTEEVRGMGGMEKSSTWHEDLDQFADAPLWKEDWTAEDEKGNAVTLSVDAKISLPDAGQMFVAEAKEQIYDASYQQNFAERIFGGAEIYYHDLAHWTRKELEEERAELVEQMDAIENAEYFMENAEDFMEESKKKLIVYDELLETANDAYTLAEVYDAGEYLGERSGISYELFFEEDDGGAYRAYRSKRIVLSPKDVYQVCPKDMYTMEGLDFSVEYTGSSPCPNQCGLSEEKAREMAEDFVSELGLNYPIFCRFYPLLWSGSKEKEKDITYTMANGYAVAFDAGIDSLSFPQFGYQEQYEHYSDKKKEEEKGKYDLRACLTVLVTDDGVIGMTAENPIEITGVSEGVGLLPLDAIKGIIGEQIVEHFEDFRFDYASSDSTVSFDRMELIYFRIREKEASEEFCYVPAWRLFERTSSYPDNPFIRNQVLINAIDGSVIDFYDEV